MAIRTPVSTSLNDFKQREAACLHVPLFSVLGSLIPRPIKVVGRADQINSKLGQIFPFHLITELRATNEI